jgi:hypothetical protein
LVSMTDKKADSDVGFFVRFHWFGGRQGHDPL